MLYPRLAGRVSWYTALTISVLALLVGACGSDGAVTTAVETSATSAEIVSAAPASSTAETDTTMPVSTTLAAPTSTEPPLVGPVTPDGWVSYTHPSHGWSISLPPEGWELDDSGVAAGNAPLWTYKDGSPVLAFGAADDPAPEDTGTEDYARFYMGMWGFDGDYITVGRDDLPQPFVTFSSDVVLGDGLTVPATLGFYYDPDAEPPVAYFMSAIGMDLENRDLVGDVLSILMSLQLPGS